MSESLRLRIDNRLHELDRLRKEVDGFLSRCDVSGRPAHHIQLALDELVTNIIHYAYESQGGRAIDLKLKRHHGRVDMTLMDDGKPFNPLTVPEPDVHSTVCERSVGGLGIHFARMIMDEMVYERKDGKNILHIRKKTS